MAEKSIYLDYHATTPVDDRVFARMAPMFTEKFANPASKNHTPGREVAALVEHSRSQVAQLVGAAAEEIVFTSGATEAINLALKGAASMGRLDGGHIITFETEHRATLDTCKVLQRAGCSVTFLPVGTDGLIDIEQVQQAVRENTFLISVLHGNNEIGVIQPVKALGALCHQHGLLLHIDAAQSCATMPIDVRSMGAHLLSLSAHKMYGPMGIGALYVRRRDPRVRLQAQMHGGGHEKGRRSGTLPAPLVVGFGAACELASQIMETDRSRIATLRDRLVGGLSAQLDAVVYNGHPEKRLAGNASLTFRGVNGAALIRALPALAVSRGSACTTEEPEPSHVLQAIGLSREDAEATLRFGLGRFTTADEIETAIAMVAEAVQTLRSEMLQMAA